MENDKRNYLQPSVEVTEIKTKSVLLAGTNVGMSNIQATTKSTDNGDEYDTLSRGGSWDED